jgi:hypothetical protein
VQQEKHRRVFRAGLSVKDGEPVSRPCDKKPGVPWDGCLLELGPAIEMMPASAKPPMLRSGPAGVGFSETR